MQVFPFPKFFKVEATTHFPTWTSLCEQTEQANNQRQNLLPRKKMCRTEYLLRTIQSEKHP